jgi:Tfp pilus assembly protein PilF
LALKERPGVFHVAQGDFDTLMIEVAEELNLTMPGFDRWRSLFETYQQALNRQAQTADTEKGSAARLRRQLDASRLEAEAKLLADSDPENADRLFREALDIDPDNIEALSGYARFLASTSRDLDRADEMYRRSIALDPRNEDVLFDYAIMLHHVRHDLERAEQMLRSLYELNPLEANYLGNYAQVLFAQRRDEDATFMADAALELPNASEALVLEISFYRYAHMPRRYPLALVDIAELLLEGVRSEDWSFSPNLYRAKEDGDKRLSLLNELAKVINGTKPLQDLARFKLWRDAFKQAEERQLDEKR